MPASTGASGGGGAGDEDIDPATGLPRVPVQGGPGLLDPLKTAIAGELQNPSLVTRALFPTISSVGDAVRGYENSTTANVTPGSAADVLLKGTPSENYDRQEPEIPQAAPVVPSQPVTPAPKKAGGGGGGAGGAALPLGPSAGEVVARGAVQTAREGENEAQAAKGTALQATADQNAALDIVQRERERQLQQQTDQRAAELNADLKAKQDVLAKDRIHDMFEGRPLAAVVAALSSGLGAFAATRTGGVNHAQSILDNAAQMFRQKELHRIEQEEKGVSSAQEGIRYADTRADAAMAQLYRSFARDREALLRQRGYTDEQIANDVLIKQNVAKGAEQDLQWQQRNSEIARQEVNDRAQRAVQGATAAHLNAETGKLRAETAAIASGAGGKEPGKGITDARQRAFLSNGLIHEDERAKKLEASGIKLDEKDLERIQDNRTFLSAQKEGHGDADALKTVLLRKWGVVPRSEFDGLDDRKQELAGALNLMTQKAALLNAGSMTTEGIKHSAGIVDLLAPSIGDRERARRRDYIRTGIVGTNEGLVPGSMAAARSGSDAAAAREAAPAPAAPAKLPPLTPAQRVLTKQWLDANKSNPQEADRVARARARLMEP